MKILILFLFVSISAFSKDSIYEVTDKAELQDVLSRNDFVLKNRLMAKALIEGQLPKVSKLQFIKSELETVNPNGNGFSVKCVYVERAYEGSRILEEYSFSLSGPCL